MVKLGRHLLRYCLYEMFLQNVAYGKLPAVESAPLLHGRDGVAGLTDFRTRIRQAVLIVSLHS